jgi:TonB family protein
MARSSAIFAHLLAHKPSGGEAKGAVTVSFSLSRGGHLLGAHLAASAGSSALDQRALAMVRSANPFPAAPADVAGGIIHRPGPLPLTDASCHLHPLSNFYRLLARLPLTSDLLLATPKIGS